MAIKKILVSLAALCLLFAGGRWLHLQFAYAEVERLTEQHGGELSSALNKSIADDPLFNADGVSARLDYFKVFEYSEGQAKVFIVISYDAAQLKAPTLHDRFGQFRYFLQQNGEWVVDQSKRPYQIVWDGLGSADDETWPPYH